MWGQLPLGWNSRGSLAVSTSSILSLQSDLSKIQPVISASKVPGASPATYLGPLSCLGYMGPIGPYGPLGMLGPIGSNSWNPSAWITAAGSWSAWETSVKVGGLSADGPLGDKGPISRDQYFGLENPGKTLFATNDFAVHLRAFGIWAALGPISALGALGPLGPLGPLGSHGCKANANGEYVCGGKLTRKVEVTTKKGPKTFELFEKYADSFAKKMKDNDSSFMVIGSGNLNEYSFSSFSEQIISVLVVPEKQLDDFDLELLDGNKKIVARSNTPNYIDFIQLRVAKNSKWTARIKLKASYHFLSKTFRLFVIGSGSELMASNVAGPHVFDWSKTSLK